MTSPSPSAAGAFVPPPSAGEGKLARSDSRERGVLLRRDAYLKAQGFRILRFWNHDIFTNEEAVTETIFRALDDPSPSQACGLGPSLSRRGERGKSGVHHG
ncbi:DUF559 domain-containing protein [Sphingomonas sp.]|uniref:endonuclease domain-containing protein n=1 Tax=Sphingomonas sp. TaxID=28214 RepID=UPI00343556D4